MASLIAEFQRDIVSGVTGVTDLLRKAKLIAAKLNLPVMEEWVEHELDGYPEEMAVPKYRYMTGVLKVLNPHRGWLLGSGDGLPPWPNHQPISEIEDNSKKKSIAVRPQRHIPLTDEFGESDGIINSFAQAVEFSGTAFKRVLESVKNRLLDWSTDLEKRGIKGENMSFNEEEKRAAQPINIHGNFSGNLITGTVSNSTVTHYDYSQLYSSLKTANVSQEIRNELENLIDEVNAAKPGEKPGVLRRLSQWTLDNAEKLGTAYVVLKEKFGL